MNTSKKTLILLLAIFLTQVVRANNGENGGKKSLEASVQGYVRDANTRKPVTGVTVSVSSNKLRNGKEIQSDASGCFTFEQLPAGDLTLMFAKKGYKLFKSELPSIKGGSILKISIDFKPVEEENDMWLPLLKLLN